ncbi:PfkB family carbohydrate kinase [Roseibacterium sp. SDUM158017]|uniref:PfkB family carbohydrate kinase n=1 Tax=Roseicyclus salinarum TaxID=3036773 RepID=UPI00241582AF|nr:PfkB family carbohydrate kinase [Roseibacterium sp. SDUM158017]MDG4648832.1 PfkB family carbohydrate kinase [Roseibacterium sp. SDUM158017]
MSARPDILCIGSVLWDVIGRAPVAMQAGHDRPGRIMRLPGGVALNIAVTLRRFDLTPALLTVVGDDPDGRDLLAECGRMGLVTEHVLVDGDLPTDRYMAIEGAGELVAAIADAHSLERAGARILSPLSDGRLGTSGAPYRGAIAIDGNLTQETLAEIAASPAFAEADLRLVPASPGKAERLRPLLGHPRATLYVNREEAALIAGVACASAEDGARALHAAGARRVVVTNGGGEAVKADAEGLWRATPRAVVARRITGAGDTFMAAHIAAELRGLGRQEALEAAAKAAADYVAEEDDA